ncbi:MAG: pilus assembly protein [Coriobacteriales bacterium]|nr:pilus assembly protein [Coriobacteriales bacterium]
MHLRSVPADESGQSTVEAAVFLPVFLVLIMLLCQPAILLYDRVVMENAAAEGCRLLATRSTAADGGYAAQKYEGYVLRRLGSIPPIDAFHVHGDACSYEIVLEGNENSGQVSVRISNKLRPLPLLGFIPRALGACDQDGLITLEVEVSMPSQPGWVEGSPNEWRKVWK